MDKAYQVNGNEIPNFRDVDMEIKGYYQQKKRDKGKILLTENTQFLIGSLWNCLEIL